MISVEHSNRGGRCNASQVRRRVYRNGLACARWLRLSSAGGSLPTIGNWLCRRGVGLRPNGVDHGLRYRPCLRLPPQPGSLSRALGRRPVQGQRVAALCCCAGVRGHCWRRHSLCNRERKSRPRRSRWLRQQWLWRSFAGRIFDGGRSHVRNRDDLWLCVRDPRLDPWQRTSGICFDRHWPLPNIDPSHQYSSDKHFGESGPQYWACNLCRRLGVRATLVVLDGPTYRRCHRWHSLSVDGRRRAPTN